MERQIKLIWDFRGAAALQTAQHHEIHLKEYLIAENIPNALTGHKAVNEMYAIAFVVVTDTYLIKLRDALKPHRGEIFEPTV